MIRNRYLVKLWLLCFKVMAMTALKDRDYALTTGGILAGLIPARQGLSPDILAKSLFHGPAFWMEALGINSSDPLRDVPTKGLQFLAWQNQVTRRSVEDFDWVSTWLQEVFSKQRDVVSVLANAAWRSDNQDQHAAAAHSLHVLR